LPEIENEKKMPLYPSKRGALFNVPESIRPELIRTGIEVCFVGGDFESEE
jgi:hypothetical protein